MTIKEKITEKEYNVKDLLEKLRNRLNNESKTFNKDPNSWSYIMSLTYTETKLKEIIEYFEATPGN